MDATAAMGRPAHSLTVSLSEVAAHGLTGDHGLGRLARPLSAYGRRIVTVETPGKRSYSYRFSVIN